MTIAQQIEEIGIKKGMQQGKLEGEKQATLKLAKQFLANGVNLEVVKLSTGLSDEELKTLDKD